MKKKSSANALRYDTQETKSGAIDIPASYILSFILQKQTFMHIQLQWHLMATLKKKKGDSLFRSLSKILTSEVFFQLNKMNEQIVLIIQDLYYFFEMC